MLNENDKHCATKEKTLNVLLKTIAFVSIVLLLSLLSIHFFAYDSTSVLNFDMVFFSICTYGFFKKELELAKFGFFWFIIVQILSMITFNALSIYILSGFLIFFVWIGVFSLSRLKNQTFYFNKNIFKPFTFLHPKSKRVIGLISAFFLLLQFIPYNPHIAVLWVVIYIISILKGASEVAKVMLVLWAIPHIVSLGKTVYAANSLLNAAILTVIVFFVGHSVLLLMGISGVKEMNPKEINPLLFQN